MKYFVINTPPNQDGIIRLYEKDFHYLARVRRLKSGDCFDAILPNKTKARIRILSTVNKILIGECLEALEHTKVPVQPLTPIALFQGLPKGNKMDLIVRQAAEGGVSLVIPFYCEHTSSLSSAEKTKRWEKIIKEARQQSGSAMDTQIRSPCSINELLEYWETIKKQYKRPSGIILHQEPLAKGSFHDYLSNEPDFAVLAVGPEGGFSPGELSLFLSAGFKPLLMGSTVLRTETAALYGCAAIRILLLERESWTSSLKE